MRVQRPEASLPHCYAEPYTVQIRYLSLDSHFILRNSDFQILWSNSCSPKFNYVNLWVKLCQGELLEKFSHSLSLDRCELKLMLKWKTRGTFLLLPRFYKYCTVLVL